MMLRVWPRFIVVLMVVSFWVAMQACGDSEDPEGAVEEERIRERILALPTMTGDSAQMVIDAIEGGGLSIELLDYFISVGIRSGGPVIRLTGDEVTIRKVEGGDELTMSVTEATSADRGGQAIPASDLREGEMVILHPLGDSGVARRIESLSEPIRRP